MLVAHFAWHHRPRALTTAALRDSVGAAGFDLAVEIGLIRGCVEDAPLSSDGDDTSSSRRWRVLVMANSTSIMVPER